MSKFGPPPIPEEELLDEIRRLADDLDRTPTTREMVEQGAYSDKVYFDRFETWTAAVEAAGLTPNPQRGLVPTDEELLDELRRLADELGHSPTRREMREYGNHSDSTYARRFGSWADALAEVDLMTYRPGLKPQQRRLIQQLREAEQ